MNLGDFVKEYKKAENEISYLMSVLSDIEQEKEHVEKISDTIAKLLAHIECKIDLLSDKQDSIITVIEKIPTILHRSIVYKHAVEGTPFSQIAEQLNYSERHTIRLYMEGIDYLNGL